MKLSQLRIYSYGIAAKNKALNSPDLEVTPQEDLTMLDGEITDNVNSLSSKANNADGVAYESKIDTTITVKATWLPLGNSNRMTAPDVRRGESIVLYQFGDADRYYWTTLKNDLAFRKLETVVYGFSATKDESATPDEDNTYIFEVSTHKKLIRLHTTQANGEPFGYDITLNTDEGYFKILDTIGNTILLDSQEHTIRFEDTEGSFIDLTKNVLTIVTGERVDIKTKATTINTDTLDINASASATLTTPKNTITATTTHNGDTTHVGNTLHQGNIALQGVIGQTPGGGGGGGASSFSDPVTFDNTVEVSSDLNVSGTMHAGKVISDAPISAPNV